MNTIKPLTFSILSKSAQKLALNPSFYNLAFQDRLFKSLEEIVGVTKEQILSKSRKAEYIMAKYIGIHIMVSYTNMKIKRIAVMFNIDRTTVLYATKCHKNDYQFNKKYKVLADKVEEALYISADTTFKIT